MIRVDTVGFGDLIRDMRKASARVGAELVPVVRKGAGNVKDGMQSDIRKSKHFGSSKDGGQVARSVDYDVERTPVKVEAEIGPNRDRAKVAALAHIMYFGGVNGGGDSVRDPEFHAHEEVSRFERAIADVVDGLL